MNKQKITIIGISSAITILLLIIITFLLLPKDKLNGGYADTLQASNVEVRIVSTSVIANEDKATLEVVTSIWNKTNKEIVLNEQNFSLNQANPTNKIDVKIAKNEKVGVRQIYPYQTVSAYNVLLGNKKLAFDFTLKNNELKEKMVKLSETKTASIQTNLEKQKAEAEKVRSDKTDEILKENEKVKAEAEKEKTDDAKNKKAESSSNKVLELDGVFRSNNVKDDTEISFDPYYTISGKVKKCDDTMVDIQGQYMIKHEENQTYIEIQFPFEQKIMFARLLYKDANTLINQSEPISCNQGIFKRK